MPQFTRLMCKNLLRSKRRTVLTVLSIAVSLFIFAVLVSLPTFANQMLADTTSSFASSPAPRWDWAILCP